MTWTPISDEDAVSQLGEGVHTGLRKGTDADDAHVLWSAISDSETTAWFDALTFAVWGLSKMGYRLCREVKDEK